jgi:hypothetical protein
MRKLDTASNAEGSVRRESCNQEEVTTFYAIALQEEQIDAVGAIAASSTAQISTVQRQAPKSLRIESAVLLRDAPRWPSQRFSS